MPRISRAFVVVLVLLTSCSVAPGEVAMTPMDPISGSTERQIPVVETAPSAAQSTSEADVIETLDGGEETIAAGPATNSVAVTAQGGAAVGIEREPLDQATRDAYFEVAGSAHGALLADTVHQVTIDRTLRSEGLFDLSSQSTVVIDEIRGVSSADVSLTGRTWELARSGELATPPWTLAEQPAGATQLDPFRQAASVDTTDLLRGFVNLFSLDALISEQQPGQFYFEIPHRDILSWQYGASVSPWTSVLFIDQALDGQNVEGTTPVIVRFADGVLATVEIDYGPLLADAVQAGASLAFSDAVFTETYQIRITDVGGPEPVNYVAGDCYNGDVLPAIGEPTTPCSEPHLYEILSVSPTGFDADDPFPSQEEFSQKVQPICTEAFMSITGDDYRASLFGISSRAPSFQNWERGVRDFTCYVRLREPTVGQLASLDIHRLGNRVSLAGLQLGDCANGFESVESELVDCGVEHEGQVFLVTTIDRNGPRPTYDWFNDYARVQCGDAMGSLQAQNAIDVNAQSLSVRRLIPSEGMWAAGERFLVCVAVSDRPLRGSMVVSG